MTDSWWIAGASKELRAQLEEELGVGFQVGLPEQPSKGDTVVLGAGHGDSESGRLPLGSPQSVCRTLKNDPQVRVFLVASDEDAFAREIARFCLANGIVQVDEAEGRLTDASELRQRSGTRLPRTETDELLQRLENQLRTDEGKQASALQRILAGANEPRFLDRLTDAETGLFDGPFASFKLDEEFKRARRFHQPLSLILLDIGESALPAGSAERRTVLAEVASVFLTECRDIDVLGRFTESVFLFLLPGTGAAGARVLAARMVESLGDRAFNGGVRIEPALGVTTVPDADIQDRTAMLARAEACLGVAREQGGSRIVTDRDS